MGSYHLEEDSLLVVLASGGAHHYLPGEQVTGDVYLNLVAPLDVVDVEIKVWGRERTFLRKYHDKSKLKRQQKMYMDENAGKIDVDLYGHHSILKRVYRVLAKQTMQFEDNEEDPDRPETPDPPVQPPGEQIHTLDAGQHCWRFTFNLPLKIPGSFELVEQRHRATIRYRVKASLVLPSSKTQRPSPRPSTDEILVKEGLPAVVPPAKKTHYVTLSQSCRGPAEVGVSIDLSSNSQDICHVAGEDIMVGTEVFHGTYKVRRLILKLRQKINIKSLSRKDISLDRLVASSSVALPNEPPLGEAGEVSKTLKKWMFLHIPTGVTTPTCSGTLVKCLWEVTMTAELVKGFIGSSGVAEVATSFMVHLPDGVPEKRLAPHGFKVDSSYPILVVPMCIDSNPPDPAAAKSCYMIECKIPPGPRPGFLSPRKSQDSQVVESSTQAKRKYRWKEGGEDDFPPEMWGQAPASVEIRETAAFIKEKRDFGAVLFDRAAKQGREAR